MPRLFYEKNKNDVVIYDLMEGSTSLGRHPENNIVLDDKSVSKKHALITVQENDNGNTRVQIADLHSTNGTYINNNKTTYHVLSHQDEIRIGKIVLIYSEN